MEFSHNDIINDPASALLPLALAATRLILALRNVVIALGILFVIVGGIKYITSSGDPEKAASAKGTVTWAIAAIVIAILLWSLLVMILTMFGVPLSNYGIENNFIPFFFDDPANHIPGVDDSAPPCDPAVETCIE